MIYLLKIRDIYYERKIGFFTLLKFYLIRVFSLLHLVSDSHGLKTTLHRGSPQNNYNPTGQMGTCSDSQVRRPLVHETTQTGTCFGGDLLHQFIKSLYRETPLWISFIRVAATFNHLVVSQYVNATCTHHQSFSWVKIYLRSTVLSNLPGSNLYLDWHELYM